MEATQVVGVRTRARAMATAMVAVTEEMTDGLGAVKRRKLSNEKLRSTSTSFVQFKTRDECEINSNSVLEDELVDCSNESVSVRYGGGQVACCSRTVSTEKLNVLDLELESVETETETETAARYNLERSESTPTSNVKAESGELDSSKAEMNHLSPKMPPEAELEEFFAAAQADLNKRFKHKYNYDIVNDIPLKGSFEWIQLKPGK